MLTTLSYALKKIYSANPKVTKKPVKLINFPRLFPDYLSNWGLVGYIVTKYRVSGDSRTYMYSRIVSERRFRDPHAPYGS